MKVLSQLVVTLTVVIATMAGRIRRQEFNLDPSVQTPEFKDCTTKNGTKGICVDHNYCSSEFVILSEGNIIDNDIRQKTDCPRLMGWCCSHEHVDDIPLPHVTTSGKCLATNAQEKSWLAALFKSPTDTQSAPRLFCAGALVTSRVVLTAGTCLKSAQNQQLYVQIPASKSLQNYTVQKRRLHPDYNSGTHINDFGLLVLDKDVDWGEGNDKKVCLDFQTQSQGNCFTAGFSEGAITTTTMLNVQPGDCRPQVKGTGDSCGTNADSVCIVTPGAPVLCRSNDEVYTVVGVTKSNCRKDKASIGDISSVSTWLQQELSMLNLVPNIYTYNKS